MHATALRRAVQLGASLGRKDDRTTDQPVTNGDYHRQRCGSEAEATDVLGSEEPEAFAAIEDVELK